MNKGIRYAVSTWFFTAFALALFAVTAEVRAGTSPGVAAWQQYDILSDRNNNPSSATGTIITVLPADSEEARIPAELLTALIPADEAGDNEVPVRKETPNEPEPDREREIY